MDFSTRSMHIKRRPDRIVEVRMNPNWEEPDTPLVVQENIDAIKQALGLEPRGCLLFMPDYHLSKELLELYRDAEFKGAAMAFVIGSFQSKVLGNLYMKVVQQTEKELRPMQLFTQQADAEYWLKSQVVKSSTGH